MNKIYKDLNESKYVFKYFELELYFSSMFYFNKFEKKYINFIKDEKDKLKIKYMCNVDDYKCDIFLMILLYKKIEKRGFKILYEKKELSKDFYIDIEIKL